jgi:hypothetical protein
MPTLGNVRIQEGPENRKQLGLPTAEEYREFAAECFRWADQAETEEMREAFL